MAKAGLGSAPHLVQQKFPVGLSGHPGLEISSTLLFSTSAAPEFVESPSLQVFYGLCGESLHMCVFLLHHLGSAFCTNFCVLK